MFRGALARQLCATTEAVSAQVGSLRQPIDEMSSMTQRYDLVIAGGGPSGSAAAWRTAQTGAKVVVLDKAEFPGPSLAAMGLPPAP